MILTFDDARIQNDNGVWLCLKVAEPAPARKFVMDLIDSGKKYLFDLIIERHTEKRSLDANAYYWKLCGDLAKATGDKPENIYKRHIRDIGNYEALCIQEKDLKDFARRWTSNHLGRCVETRASKLPGCVTVLAYYGSSDFSRAEMSMLIDNCIQDCQAVGVEVLPPEKIDLLKEEWGN